MPVISLDKQRADAYRSVNDWAETMRFRADGAGGDAGYDVIGCVGRVKVQPLDQIPSAGGPSFTVLIVHEAERYNAADDSREYSGLNIADIRLGVSTLDIATDPGQPAKSRVIQRILDSDEASLSLECR